MRFYHPFAGAATNARVGPADAPGGRIPVAGCGARASTSTRPGILPIDEAGQAPRTLNAFDSRTACFYNRMSRADSRDHASQEIWPRAIFPPGARAFTSGVTYFSKPADRISRSLPLRSEGVLIHGRS